MNPTGWLRYSVSRNAQSHHFMPSNTNYLQDGPCSPSRLRVMRSPRGRGTVAARSSACPGWPYCSSTRLGVSLSPWLP